MRANSRTPDKFWASVDIRGPDECWPWKGAGSRTHDTYGRYNDFVPNGKLRNAHVIAWELYNGRSIGTKVGRHTCDNPPCCNPTHIIPGTRKQNTKDMIDRGRDNFLGGKPKVTTKQVMKAIRDNPNLFHYEVAKLLGVSRETISNHVRGVVFVKELW